MINKVFLFSCLVSIASYSSGLQPNVPIDGAHGQQAINSQQVPGAYENEVRVSKDPQRAMLELFNAVLQENYEDINIIKVERIAGNTEALRNYGEVDEQTINIIFERLHQKVNNNDLNLIVFNETFFGKKQPFNDEQFRQIEDRIKGFTTKHKNTIIHANFLKHGDTTLPKEELRQIAIRIAEINAKDGFIPNEGGQIASSRFPAMCIDHLYSMLSDEPIVRSIMIRKNTQEELQEFVGEALNINADFFDLNPECIVTFYDGTVFNYSLAQCNKPAYNLECEFVEDYMKKQVERLRSLSLAGDQQVHALSNFSSTYHGGNEMTRYYKSSYYEEVEDHYLTSGQMLYILGNGTDIDIAKTDVSEAIQRCISTQICADIIRRTRGIPGKGFLENKQGSQSVYHIIVSNNSCIYDWLTKHHVPLDKIIVHADSYDSLPYLFFRSSRDSNIRFTVPVLEPNLDYVRFHTGLPDLGRDNDEPIEARSTEGEEIVARDSLEPTYEDPIKDQYVYKITTMKMNLR